jgi:TRAP-type C4-dicarboxylate transport system permease small subunit
MIIAGVLALISAGFIAYLALSKKTGAVLKRVAIIALVLICLTFLVCTLFLFLSSSYRVTRTGNADFPVIPVSEGKDITPILIAAIAVLLFMILIIVLYFREQRRKK